MMRIKGNFNGRYQAKQDDKTASRLYHYKYFMKILPDGNIHDTKEISDYQIPKELKTCELNFDSLHDVNIFFAQGQAKSKLNDSIHEILIQNAVVTEIGKQGNITYGTISGDIFATIGNPPKVADTVKKVVIDNLAEKITTDEPLSKSFPKPTVASVEDNSPTKLNRNSTWKWWDSVGCLGRLLSLLFLLLFLIWLLSNENFQCNKPTPPIPPPVYEDSTKVQSNDTLTVQSNIVSLSVYDWDLEDGDAVNVCLNGTTLSQNLTIKKEPYTWYINDLKEGRNELLVTSANQGNSGVTTPTFELNDGINVKVFRANCTPNQPNKIHIQYHSSK